MRWRCREMTSMRGADSRTQAASAATNVAKWNGSSWSALGSGLSGPADYPFWGRSVSALVVLGSNLYAGGISPLPAVSRANFIAKWNGSSWSALGSGISQSNIPLFGLAAVLALVVSGNDVYAGGISQPQGGTAATNIAKWDGTVGRPWVREWTLSAMCKRWRHPAATCMREATLPRRAARRPPTLPCGTGAVGRPWVRVCRRRSWAAGGDSFAGGVRQHRVCGGYFTTAGGLAANFIAEWDGSSWSALGSGVSGFLGPYYPGVFALAVSSRNLYAGGSFSAAGESKALGVAKWSRSRWSALGSGMDGTVGVLTVSGSDLYVAGQFTRVFSATGSISANYVAKMDGNSWSALGRG